MQYYTPSEDWGLPIKKTLVHPKADAVLRIIFQQKLKIYEWEQRTIVYLDESGFAESMPRISGYSIRGERCYGEHDWHARGRQNIIGAIRNNQLFATRSFDSSIDSDVFYSWLTEALIPELPTNSVIILDNAAFHKRSDMIAVIHVAGHTLCFLPPYSPDFNPIEKKWAQIKSFRRRYRCTSLDALASFL